MRAKQFTDDRSDTLDLGSAMKPCVSQRVLNSVLCVLLLAIVQACIGGTTLYTATIHIPAPALEYGRIHATETGPGLQVADLLNSWGPPTEIDHVSSVKARWTYIGPNLRWHGVIVALVIVPLPLCWPMGHERVTFVIDDTLVAEAIVYVKDESTTWCGFIYTGEGGVAKFGLYEKSETSRVKAIRRDGLNWSTTQPEAGPNYQAEEQ